MDMEELHLKETLNKYDEVIEDSYLKMSNLKDLFRHDPDTMLEEKLKLEADIRSIERAKLVPYFARIDFKTNENYDKCYIGKRGVVDYDNNVITVDWRAPISSIYYDSNVGKASYNAPDGMIEGDLLLKRQYVIEDSNLVSFNDVDTVSNDELLKPYLSVSADNRLKNIVSTIQGEQNAIIREKLGKNLVIQGVAGSGKTTVALHRIAYLVYNNRDLFKPSDYMVIGPNKFFVSYISGILPDLDVNGVIQNTLEEVFNDFVNEPFHINNSLDVMKDKDMEASFKVSMNMKKEIDNYFDNLELLPNEDFIVNDIKILSKEFIKNTYDEIGDTYNNVRSKIDRLILLLDKYINDNIDNISKKYITSNVSQKELITFRNSIVFNLKKYFNIVNTKCKKAYIDILNSMYFDINNIERNLINVEDIPSLIYIKEKLSGSRKYDNFKHIVIDEAQDYGEFTFYTLKKIFKNSTFSIYGDLAQSLYPYRSLTNWQSLNDIFDNFDILKLNKSYRTTIEIMDEANKINELLHLDKAIPVIRHGDKVEYFNNDVLSIINSVKDTYKTIALITKDQDKANNLYNDLKDKIAINLITKDNLSYNSNITVLPSYLSKGLEFDVVIILGEDDFNKDSVLDMKLLYVSKTRALHKLFIRKCIL